MSGPVDVLAVMLRAIEAIDPDVTLSPGQLAVDMGKARAALAELIEKAGALNGVKRAGGILVSFDSFADLAIALAGVGGAP